MRTRAGRAETLRAFLPASRTLTGASLTSRVTNRVVSLPAMFIPLTAGRPTVLVCDDRILSFVAFPITLVYEHIGAFAVSRLLIRFKNFTTMRAIHIKCRSQAAILEKPRPTVPGGYILVQPIAVAVQPSDWKHVDFIFVGDPTGVRLGFEYAGNVVAIGSNTICDYKIGDRVFGLCHAT